MDLIGERYGTFDPFKIAEKINVGVDWCDLAARPYAETIYYGQEPIIMMSNVVKESPEKYFVLSHELGHVLEHKGLSAYYIANDHFHSKSENEADKFAISMITRLYIEENGKVPYSYQDLRYQYGAPVIGTENI